MDDTGGRATKPGTVILDARLLAYRRGGIARYIESLGRALAQLARDRSTTAELTFRLLANRQRSGLPLPTVRCWTPPHHRFEYWTLGAELTLHRPALYHATDFVLPALPQWIRRVVTIHDLAFLDAPWELEPAAWRYYARTIPSASAADRIIAVSHATAVRLCEHCPEVADRIRIIYHGVDPRWFEPLPDARATVTATFGPIVNRPLLLAVGTVEPRKGYELLLDAFRIVWEKFSREPLLVIVGQVGWNVQNTVRRLRAEQAAGRILWVREANDDLLRAVYAVSSLLVVASREEGFCLPALEAMATGVPVVAFAVGALPEVLGDAGVLVHDRTAEALAATICDLLSDESLRCRLVETGKARAAQFSWQETARNTLQVYREALGER